MQIQPSSQSPSLTSGPYPRPQQAQRAHPHHLAYFFPIRWANRDRIYRPHCATYPHTCSPNKASFFTLAISAPHCFKTLFVSLYPFSHHTFLVCTLSRSYGPRTCWSDVKTVSLVSSSPTYSRSDYISDKSNFPLFSFLQIYFVSCVFLIVVSVHVLRANLFQSYCIFLHSLLSNYIVSDKASTTTQAELRSSVTILLALNLCVIL